MGSSDNTRSAHDARASGEPPRGRTRRYSAAALQSSLDPVGDARAWLNSALGGHPVPPVLVVLWLGQGHLLTVLEQQAPSTRVLVLEPDAHQARQVLSRRDWLRWRTSGQLVYLVGPDYAGASEAWRVLPVGNPSGYHLMVHPGLAGEADADAVAAARTLRKIVAGAQANAAARRLFAPRYLLNTLANLPHIVGGGDVAELNEAASGLPAVLVAAGPSLDDNLAGLHSVADRVVLIAVDTALRPLRAAGIDPHFVVALDPSEANARHLMGLTPRPETLLVAEGSVDPRVFASFDGAFVFQVSDHQPWPWLGPLGLTRGRLAAWGSVLTSALDLARRLGCDPIIFTGADLAFTDERPYCRGTIYEEGWKVSRALGYDQRFTWRSEIQARGPTEATDLCGRPTQTTAALEAFRDWLVEQTRRAPRHQYINATGAGILSGGSFLQCRLQDIPLAAPVAGLRERLRALCTRADAETTMPVLARVARELRRVGDSGIEEIWTEYTMLHPADLRRTVEALADGLDAGGGDPEAHGLRLA